MREGSREDWFDQGRVGAQMPVPTAIPRGEKNPQSSFAGSPMTRLWQGAEERQTGAEAVEAIRARRESLGPPPEPVKPARGRGRWRRLRIRYL